MAPRGHARAPVFVLMAIATLASLAALAAGRRAVAEYTIDLDLPPGERYNEALTNPVFNTTVWKFYNEFFANDSVLTGILYDIVDKRGNESAEQQAEVVGLATASRLPLKFVQAVQYLYELQTLMLPIENFTQPALPAGYEALARIPWRGPGCTGIIANNSADGTVYHARNLDFSPVPIMTNLVFTGVFKKGGVEVFRSQMVAGYTMLITGMRHGTNGYTIERNTRYPAAKGHGNEEMIKNLLAGRPLNGWSLRKIMETTDNYDDAIKAIATTPFVSTEYSIVSGVKKGVIFSKAPDSVAYTQTLGKVGGNFGEREDYIIITNFDFFYHDIREYFDPTGGKMFHPRRIAAQEILNATTVLTPEALFDTINHKGVIADTIFQAIMNVETGLWNVSQPDLGTL